MLALTAATSFLHAEEDMSKPEIKVEKKKDADGRESVYMYIDGVKVHETDTTKQPLPKVVSPGKMLGAPPSDAGGLFDGVRSLLMPIGLIPKEAPVNGRWLMKRWSQFVAPDTCNRKKRLVHANFISSGLLLQKCRAVAKGEGTAEFS